MAALTPIPTRGGPHPRASLLLRLDTPEQLGCVQLHPQGALLLAGAENGDVLLFATSSGGLVQRLVEPSKSTSPVTCVAWAELDGMERVIAGHKSGNVRVWDVERAAVVTTLVAHRADVAALACMAPLGLLATGSADTNIKLWDLLPGGCDAGRSAASNRGSSGGSGGSTHQTIREARQVLKGHSAPLTQLRFTPDGELLISGDAAGGLQVWHVAGGAAGRLLHDLSGTHTAAITGIACHPEERLFATCSLDRTLRVWDLDGAQAGRCIGVHGPEGRREARALAFAGARAGGADGSGSGAVLLAAYADGLRTFSPDPLQHHDTADLPWSKVAAIHYTDGKLIGVTVHRGDASLHCIDLTRVKPFVGGGGEGGAAAARSAGPSQAEEAALGGGIKLRFSDKYRVAAAGPASASAAAPVAPEPTTANTATAGAGARAAEQPGPAALFVAQQRERVAALAAKAGSAGPAVEVLAATRRRAQQASAAAAAPSRAALAAAAPGADNMPPSGRATPPGESRASRHRLSAQENFAGPATSDSGTPASKAVLPAVSNGAATPELPSVGPQQHAAPSMQAVCTQQGLPAAGLQGSAHLQRFIQASRALQEEVTRALQRRDARRALAILRDHKDSQVSGAVLRNRAFQSLVASSLFSLEVCTAFVPLINLLLPAAAVGGAAHATAHHQAVGAAAGARAAYPTARHQAAALQLLEAVLARWGGYLRDVLSGVRHRKVDLELERRQERSRALRAALQGLAPGLERVAAAPLGGGSAKQMLARVAAL